MAKNLSLNFGIPSSLKGGKDQHNVLAEKLQNNEVFTFRSQNRGYLALEKATGKYRNVGYFNILYNTKPLKKGILKLTKV